MTGEFISGGYLQDMHVMFKLYEDEWCHFKVLSFIPVEARPGDSLFSNVAQIIGVSRGKLPVFFDIAKYSDQASFDAALATWFMLEVA